MRIREKHSQTGRDIPGELLSAAAKEGVRWLARSGLLAGDIAAPEIMVALEIGLRLAELVSPYIKAYFDPPQTLEALQAAVRNRPTGYDNHHVVERWTKAKDKSEDARVEAPENLVRIPTLKYWELNSWYQTSAKRYDGATPREYMRG